MNLIDAVVQDHEEVKAMFARIEGADGDRRQELFAELRAELIRHEVAEQQIVRPLTQQHVPDGQQLAEHLIQEESEAEQLLKDMEGDTVGTPAWNAHFARLRTAVLDHAEREESTELARLRTTAREDELERKGETFESAKKLAPTRPHPNVPSDGVAGKMLGPVSGLVDRARDAVGKAMAG